jgi:hypothetical protein
VALPTGLLVGGTVFDSAGAGKPVVNVNIDAIDAVSGASIPLSHDRSDATGAYGIALPAGSYILQYQPEKCTLLVAQESAAPVTVAADTTLPQVSLQAGVLATGMVTDTRSVPVLDVNTAWYGSNGVKVFTTNDHRRRGSVQRGRASRHLPDRLRAAGRCILRRAQHGVSIGNNPAPSRGQLPVFRDGAQRRSAGRRSKGLPDLLRRREHHPEGLYRGTTDAAGFRWLAPPGL